MNIPPFPFRALAALLLASAAPAVLFAQAVPPPADAAPPAPALPSPAAITAASVANANAASAAADADDRGEDVVVLEEFHVRTSKEASYIGATATAGARVVADIIDMPFDISVLSKDFIDDFQLFSLEEQGAYIGGMTPGDPSAGSPTNSLRGYSVPYFRNGFRRTQPPESNSIRQTEVIRGPQSALFGRAAPGGVVNALPKEPRTKFITGASVNWGSYDYQRATAYATGPLVPGKLFYRVDAEYYDRERNTDYYFQRVRNLSGTLRWKITSDTTLTAEIEHTNKLYNDYSAGVYWIDRTADPDYALFLTNPFNPAYLEPEDKSTWRRRPITLYTDSAIRDRLMQFNAAGPERRSTRRNTSSYLQLAHRFAPDFSMRVNFGYSKRDMFQTTDNSLVVWDPDYAFDPVASTVSSAYLYDAGSGAVSRVSSGMWGLDAATYAANTPLPGRRGGVTHVDHDYDEFGFQVDFTKSWRTDSGIRQSSLLTFDYFRNRHTQRSYEIVYSGIDDAADNHLRAAIAAALGYTAADLPREVFNAWLSPNPFNLDPVYALTPAFSFGPGSFWSRGQANNTSPGSFRFSNSWDVDELTYGALLSHQVSLFSDRLYLIASVRQDFSEIAREYPFTPVVQNDDGTVFDVRESTGNARAMSYSVGASFGLIGKKLVGYLSYGKSFDPDSSRVDPNTGAIYTAREARGVDFGLKGLILTSGNRQLSYTFSLYSITQVNEVGDNPDSLADPENKSIPRLLEGYATRGRGMSLEVTGNNFLVNGLRLHGSISWLDKIYKENPYAELVGTRAENSPVRMAGIGVSYSPRVAFLKGFGGGLSFTHAAARLRTAASPATDGRLAQDAYFIPAQNFVGAFLNYRRTILKKRTLLFQLNVTNLFDNMVISPAYFMPDGRTIRGTITLEY
jgi:outer membrane receptor protein involved in Fe transport